MKLLKEQAGQLLMSYIEDDKFADKLYEFAQNLCNEVIKEIESKHTIVDADGITYSSEDEETWYDEYREDFIKAVFEKHS